MAINTLWLDIALRYYPIFFITTSPFSFSLLLNTWHVPLMFSSFGVGLCDVDYVGDIIERKTTIKSFKTLSLSQAKGNQL